MSTKHSYHTYREEKRKKEKKKHSTTITFAWTKKNKENGWETMDSQVNFSILSGFSTKISLDSI